MVIIIKVGQHGFPQARKRPREAGWLPAVPFTPTFAADDVDEGHMLAPKRSDLTGCSFF